MTKVVPGRTLTAALLFLAGPLTAASAHPLQGPSEQPARSAFGHPEFESTEIDGYGHWVLDGRWAFLIAGESRGDRNGDGDRWDAVGHIYDLRTKRTINLLAAGANLKVSGGYAIFASNERDVGGDLNKDGDAFDTAVLQACDLEAGVLSNLRLATPLWGLEVIGERAYFLVDEWLQGAHDLNGDTDAKDRVLHSVHLPSLQVRNHGLAVVTVWPASRPQQLLILLRESDLGQDFNGDGDQTDQGIALYHAGADRLQVVPMAAVPQAVDGPFVYLGVPEDQQGGQDLNGDGDTLDTVAHVFDQRSGAIENIGYAGRWIRAQDGRALLGMGEEGNAQDLNGDGDLLDGTTLLLDHARGLRVNLGLAVWEARVGRERVLLHVGEADQAGTDLNGDGDIDDRVLVSVALDGRDARVIPYAVEWDQIQTYTSERVMSFLVREELQGGADLNGDGDVNDNFPLLYDLDHDHAEFSLRSVNRMFPITRGSRALVVQSELLSRVDLNGDGDLDDKVAFVYDAPAKRWIDTGRATGASDLLDDCTLLHFAEADSGEDLNGDGDQLDWVFHLLCDDARGLINLRMTGGLTYSPGSPLPFIRTRETEQGQDLNGDGRLAGEYCLVLRK